MKKNEITNYIKYVKYDGEIFKIIFELSPNLITWSDIYLLNEKGLLKHMRVSHRALNSKVSIGLHAQLKFLIKGSIYTKMLLSSYWLKDSVDYEYFDRYRYFLALPKEKIIHTHLGSFEYHNCHKIKSRSSDYMIKVLECMAFEMFYDYFEHSTEDEWNQQINY